MFTLYGTSVGEPASFQYDFVFAPLQLPLRDVITRSLTIREAFQEFQFSSRQTDTVVPEKIGVDSQIKAHEG